jgi:MFS family permease
MTNGFAKSADGAASSIMKKFTDMLRWIAFGRFERAPDGGWGWVVAAASFCIHFFVLGSQYSFGLLFKVAHPTLFPLKHFFSSRRPTFQALLEDPEISDGNSASSAVIGSLSSAAMLGFSSLAGPLVRRHGARATAAAGACLSGLGLAMASAAPSLPLLAAAYGGVAGVGFALAWAPSVVVVGAYFTGSRRAVATGLAVSGSGVGTVVLAQVDGETCCTATH